MRNSRAFLSDAAAKHGLLPFSLRYTSCGLLWTLSEKFLDFASEFRSSEDESRARLALGECFRHGVRDRCLNIYLKYIMVRSSNFPRLCSRMTLWSNSRRLWLSSARCRYFLCFFVYAHLQVLLTESGTLRVTAGSLPTGLVKSSQSVKDKALFQLINSSLSGKKKKSAAKADKVPHLYYPRYVCTIVLI